MNRPTTVAPDDPRLDRAVEITRELARHLELVAERRVLLRELRAEGVPMAAIARALGITRARLYGLLDER